MTEDRIVWVDIETTGLSVDDDQLLEVGCIVTDSDLNPLDDGVSCIITPLRSLDGMSDFVRNMHASSGLLDQLGTHGVGIDWAASTIAGYIHHRIPVAKLAPLAGSSVHFDRAFLARDMPIVDDYLHYRHIDVSTVKELVRRWNPAAFEARPVPKGQHRALPDLHDSIEELRWYRATGLTA